MDSNPLANDGFSSPPVAPGEITSQTHRLEGWGDEYTMDWNPQTSHDTAVSSPISQPAHVQTDKDLTPLSQANNDQGWIPGMGGQSIYDGCFYEGINLNPASYGFGNSSGNMYTGSMVFDNTDTFAAGMFFDNDISSTYTAGGTTDLPIMYLDGGLYNTMGAYNAMCTSDMVFDSNLPEGTDIGNDMLTPGLVLDNDMSMQGLVFGNDMLAPGLVFDNDMSAQGLVFGNDMLAQGQEQQQFPQETLTQAINRVLQTRLAVKERGRYPSRYNKVFPRPRGAIHGPSKLRTMWRVGEPQWMDEEMAQWLEDFSP
ncbi:hypothetical protein QBC33DRAFT_136534 [Phialemonium atrogriseum]|uniref:Uncharacterized protein n=1 Tax=Phialemonium atrogriseum TaxID=1093897 RepID=A0AAJ0FJW9_9PEZI|nr:uncharacterized protein QBC33DRAFT_136534 [Phialemonium atrogriseum]KAK1765793.1 hypothetical protein QBC33DRAFT_136534 [Phialemonium atrogriseum]